MVASVNPNAAAAPPPSPPTPTASPTVSPTASPTASPSSQAASYTAGMQVGQQVLQSETQNASATPAARQQAAEMAFVNSWNSQPQQSFQQWSQGVAQSLLPPANDEGDITPYVNALSDMQNATTFALTGVSSTDAQSAGGLFGSEEMQVPNWQQLASPSASFSTSGFTPAAGGTAGALAPGATSSAGSTPTSTTTSPAGTGQLGTNGPTEGTPLFTAYAAATGSQDLYIQATELPGTDSQTLVSATSAYIQSVNNYRQALSSPSASPYADWAATQKSALDSNFAVPMITAAGVTAPLGDNGQPLQQIGSENRQLPDPAQFDIGNLQNGYVAPPPIPVMQPGESTADYDTAMENVFQHSMSTDQIAYVGWMIGQNAQGRQINISDSEAQSARTNAVSGQQNSPTADGAHDAQAWSAMATYLQSAHATDLVQQNNNNDSDGAFKGPINDSDGILNAGYFSSDPPSFGQSLGQSLLGTLSAIGTNPIVEAVADATGQQWLTDLPIDPGALPGLSVVQGVAKGLSKAGEAAADAVGGASKVATDAFSAANVGDKAAANQAVLNAADSNLLKPSSDTSAAPGSPEATASSSGSSTSSGSATYQATGTAGASQPITGASRAPWLAASDDTQVPIDSAQLASGAKYTAIPAPIRGTSVQDVLSSMDQGSLDDCTTTALVRARLQKPDGQQWLDGLLSSETATSATFNLNGDQVTVGKTVATDANGNYIYGGTKGGSTYWPLLEKAYAKEAQANGYGTGYSALNALPIDQATSSTFGQTALSGLGTYQKGAGGWSYFKYNQPKMQLGSSVPNPVFSSANSSGSIGEAATLAGPTPNGFTPTHAYTINSANSAAGTITITDPHGAASAVPSGSGIVYQGNGVITMPYATFLANFGEFSFLPTT